MAGKSAARLGDLTAHGKPLGPGPGSPDVWIANCLAWRAHTDHHVCPATSHKGADGVGAVQQGSATVFINQQPACREGDVVIETPGRALGPRDPIIAGCGTVFIGG